MTWIYESRDGRRIRIDDLTEAMATANDGSGRVREASPRELREISDRKIKNGDSLDRRIWD